MAAKHNLRGLVAHYGGTLSVRLFAPAPRAARPADWTRSGSPIFMAPDTGFPPAAARSHSPTLQFPAERTRPAPGSQVFSLHENPSLGIDSRRSRRARLGHTRARRPEGARVHALQPGGMVELQAAAARPAARQGGADRVLGVRMRQLPSHPAVAARDPAALRRQGLRDRQRAHARAAGRALDRQCAQGRRRAADNQSR